MRATPTPETLSDLMEFDHVIQVHEDGTVTDAPGVYGPEYLEGSTDGTREDIGPDWDLVTDGYTGQYGYSGPIMHNSESIGGALARDILALPGYYVALVCLWPDDTETDQDGPHAEGWAVAYRPAPVTPTP